MALQSVGVGVSPLETGAGQRTEFNLCHVQPTGVLGRVVKLQALHDASRLSRRKGFVQRSHAVGVQVVKDHADHWGGGIGHIHQPLHLVSEVLHGAAFGDGYVAPAGQGFTGQEEIAGAAPTVLVVLAPRSPRLGGQWRPDLGQQLGGGFVKAHHRSVGVVGLPVEVQHDLHGGHKLPVHLGDASANGGLLAPGLEGVF